MTVAERYIEQGELEGERRGELRGKVETAIEMLKIGLPIETIAQCVKMPIEWIQNLKY